MKFRLIIPLSLCCVLVACRKESEVSTAQPGSNAVSQVTASAPATSAPSALPAPETNRFFVVKGVVKEVEPEAKTVTIAHEDIPQFMPAMTMPFKVKDAKELQGLAPGDTIFFMLHVGADESWVDRIRKAPQSATNTEVAPAAQPREREPFRIARDVDPLQVGDLMTDYHFTNELGHGFNLSDYKGQALAFTFIFTRCPMPEFCPRMSKNFSEVYQKLTSMPNAPTNWHLLTITFDPTYDTPEVLRGYSMAFHNDPSRWNFATGAMIDIDAITDQFNLSIMKRGNQWDHKIRTVVVDANGRVQNIIYGNEWKPDALVEDIIKAARVTKPTSEPTAQSAQAAPNK